MTTTYSGDPTSSAKDAVRFLLGATKAPNWIFSDEEIEYVLAGQGNNYSAAAELALIKSSEYTDRQKKSVGPLSIDYGSTADRWLDLSNNLRRRAARAGGAIAISTQKSQQPYITLGLHDNPTPHLPAEWGTTP